MNKRLLAQKTDVRPTNIMRPLEAQASGGPHRPGGQSWGCRGRWAEAHSCHDLWSPQTPGHLTGRLRRSEWGWAGPQALGPPVLPVLAWPRCSGKAARALPTHLEGTLCRWPGVLGLGLLLLLTVGLEQKVVPRVDDCGQGGIELASPTWGWALQNSQVHGLFRGGWGGKGAVIGLAVLPSLGSL